MVHQADDPDPVVGPERGEFIQKGFRTDLGAKVQEVADLEHALGTGGQQFVGQFAGVVDVAPLSGMDRADTHGVENGGDPGRGKLGVMSQKGREVGPVDLGTRFDVAFDVVGVKFHETGQNQIAATVNRAVGDCIASVISVITPFSIVIEPARIRSVSEHSMAFARQRFPDMSLSHAFVKEDAGKGEFMSYSRFAIYYVPPEGPLAEFAAAWLGWDVLRGVRCRNSMCPACMTLR